MHGHCGGVKLLYVDKHISERGSFNGDLWSGQREAGWPQNSFASARGFCDSCWGASIPGALSPYHIPLSVIVLVTRKVKVDGTGGQSGAPGPASDQQNESINNITLGR